MKTEARRQTAAASAAMHLRTNLTLLWRNLRHGWRSERYPDWMMYIPNPTPTERPDRKP